MTTAQLKTYILMAALTALFGLAGSYIGGMNGALIALGFAAAMNLFTYWNADKIILRLYRAKPVDATSAPNFYETVKTMAAQAGLPMPKVYLIDNDQPNAFATGRNPRHAAVAATTGLLQILSPDEVAGVMAHELAHVKNRDTLTMTVTATIAGAISAIANFTGMFAMNRAQNGRVNPIVLIVFSILAPLVAAIIQMAISRAREYEADRIGAEISGNPAALASALAKISGKAAYLPNNTAENNPATAHLFIINPLHVRAVDGLFSTHPRTEERIRRLMAMTAARPTPTADPFAPTGFDDGPGGPWNRAA